MFKEISVSNFRTLKNVQVKNFGDVNVITGGNGTGKSTLLEAVFLNAGAGNAGLAITLNGLRGDSELNINNDAVFHSLFHDLDAKSEIKIDAHYQLPNTKVTSRTLRITPRLKQKPSPGDTGIDVFVAGLNFELASKLVNAKKEKLTKSNIHFAEPGENKPVSVSKIDSSTIVECRFVSPMAPTIRDISERIASVVKTKEIDYVVSLLKIIDPRISSVTSISEHGRNEVYVDIGLKNLMPATYMGGGFIRLLNLAISLSSDKIILIDEIENGLHHSVHKPLLEFLFKSAINLKRQLFISTHSSEFLDKLIGTMNDFPELGVSTYRCFRKDGAVSVNTYTKEELGLREQLDIELR